MWNRVYQMFRHTSCYYLPYPVLLTLIHLAPILRALPVPQKPQISKKNLNLILRNYFERTIYQVNNPLLYRAQDFPQCFCETKQILERIIVNKISYKKKLTPCGSGSIRWTYQSEIFCYHKFINRARLWIRARKIRCFKRTRVLIR